MQPERTFGWSKHGRPTRQDPRAKARLPADPRPRSAKGWTPSNCPSWGWCGTCQDRADWFRPRMAGDEPNQVDGRVGG
jgi:hypothetical protein